MTKRSIRLALAGASALMLSGAACGSPVEVCTLIGCDSGLTVQLSSLPVGAFTVEVFPESPSLHPPVTRYDCDPARSSCDTWILFPDFFPRSPYVRVTSSVGSVTLPIVDVPYQTSYPNGRQCGPACRRAFVMVDIPR
jgi:hypothetical protein